MVKLYLVRHGETEWNKEYRYQGCSNVQLSSDGIAQAEKLRRRLAMDHFDVIYSSDLSRAVETARIIASEHKAGIIPDPKLREVDFGDLEGRPIEEVNLHYPQISQAWRIHPRDLEFPGGESLDGLSVRVSSFVDGILADNSLESALIVSHGGVVRALLCTLLGLGLEHWWQLRVDIASITIVDNSAGRMILSSLNDTCHLTNPDCEREK